MRKKLFGLMFLVVVILTACKASVVFYHVRFYDENKTLLEEKLFEENVYLEIPNYTRDGYKTLGFYTEDGNKVDEKTKVTSDLNLYAKLEIIKYAINYHGIDGLINSNPLEYTIKDTITLSPVVKKDYKFAGWYLDANYTTPITTISSGSMGDMDIYAKFMPLDKYLVSFYDENKTLIVRYELNENSNLLIPEYSKEGYVFLGFYTVLGDKVDGNTKVTSNLDLYVKLEAIKYSITYHNVEGLENVNPIEYTIEDTIELSSVSKEGYTFLGWYLDSTFTKPITKIAKGTLGRLNLYAKFIAKTTTYVVNFYDENKQLITSYEVEENSNLVIPEYNKEGYNTLGFYTTLGDKVDENTIVTSNIDVYVKLEAIKYSITYHNVEGLENLNPTEYTIEDAIELSSVSKEGYTFMGWYLDSDYTQAISQIELGTSGNLDLYAKFIVKTTTYVINFYDENKQLITSYEVEENGNLLIPEYSKEGYVSLGFYTALGDKVDENTIVTSNMDVYVKLEAIKYSITYHNVEGLDNLNPIEYTIEDAIELDSVSKEGYTFLGWYLDSDYTQAISQIELGTLGNLDLYAKFTHKVDVINIEGFEYLDGVYSKTTNEATLDLAALITVTNNTTYVLYSDSELKNPIENNVNLVSGKNVFYLQLESLIDGTTKVVVINITYQNTYLVKIYYLDTLVFEDTLLEVSSKLFDEMGFEVINNSFYLDKDLNNKWDGVLDSDLTLYVDMVYVDFRVENTQVVGMNHTVKFPFKMQFKSELNALSIANGAFSNNMYVVGVDFNNAIQNINTKAFYNCRKLELVDFEGVEIIGSQAFAECDYALTSITIPSSVKEIGSYAFDNCKKLRSVTLTEGLEVIGNNAFKSNAYKDGLEEITIPNSVKKIGEYAFSGHVNLHYVKLSSNLEYLGNYTFYGCEKIATIIFNSTKMTYIGKSIIEKGSVYYQNSANWENNGLYLGDYLIMVKSDPSVTSFTLKPTTLGIADRAGNVAYNESPYLTQINLTSPVLTFIGEEVFANQDLLSNVEINCPALTSIGEDFLLDAPYLDSQDYVYSHGLLLKVNVDSPTITLPDEIKILAPGSIPTKVVSVNNSVGVTKILAEVFSGSSLTSFDFGPNLEYIGELAFSWADDLVYEVLDLSMVKYIGANAFNQAKQIKTIVIAEEAEYVGANLFMYNDATKHQIFIKGTSINPNWNQSFNKTSNAEVKTYFYSETYQENTWHYEDGVPKLW